MATNLEMLESYTSPVRTIGAKIALTDGTNTVTLTEQDKLKSAKIEKIGDQSKFFGYGVSQKLNVKAVDVEKEINLTTSHCGKLQFKVNNGDYLDASPDFKVSEVHRDEVSGEVSVTAYDALHEASKYTFADLSLTAPYTMRDVAEAIGGKIGANGIDSNHFSPNLVKPVDEWVVMQGATKSDGWITLPKSGAYAHYYIPWNYRTDTFYIKATFNSDEEVYGYYIGLQLYDDNNKVLTTVAAKYSSEVSGEQLISFGVSSINKATLKKTKRMRVFMNFRAAACRFKDVILSFKDVPYTPYGSDCAIRNLAKPIDEWKLAQGATRSDGWIHLPTSAAYADYYVPWNSSTDTFYIRATFDSDAELYSYYIGLQFVNAAGSVFFTTAATYSNSASGEAIISWNSSGLSAENKEKLKQTVKIRVFVTGRAISGVSVPYKFKDVRFSFADGEYVPYEGAPFTTVYETGANYSGNETLQEALNDIAEATQTIYYINNKGTLYFKKLDIDGAPVAEIKKNMYISLDSSTNRRLCEIVSATELGDNVAAALTISGSKQFVRNNPFWELREDIASLVDGALAAVAGLTINQFTCSWRGFPFLEIGDQIALTTKDDSTVISYFLSDTTEYNGALAQNTEWKYENNDAETASNPTTLGEALNQTYARVDKANKRIELMASEATETNEKVAALEITTSGIDASVKEVDKKVESTKSELLGAINGTEEELAAIKTTVTTNSTQIAQNAKDIALRATSEEVTTIKTDLEAVDAANKELIDANTFSVQTVEKNLSELSVTAEGIGATVESITQTIITNAEGVNNEIAEIHKKVDAQISAEDVTIAIQTEMANGVDRVETSTGYRFDEEGLTVSKTNSEMETKITEDGMKVYKNGEEVLTANNQGVDAKNLHATTYLIIGTNSRFEDYGGNRTGCFWVGGA